MPDGLSLDDALLFSVKRYTEVFFGNTCHKLINTRLRFQDEPQISKQDSDLNTKLRSQNETQSYRSLSYGRIAKKTLDEEQIIYLTHEINQMENCSQIQDVLQHMTGARTVPRVFINGKSIGGCSELTELTKRGALKEMLQSSAVKGRPTGDSNTFSSS
ncbi:uncharacterized protein [Watersipora subatra]|uniref:uncharacterized protein n=1 Tax=Watersipora subatra TaxID=2589382 RepID=UPI00355B1D8C